MRIPFGKTDRHRSYEIARTLAHSNALCSLFEREREREVPRFLERMIEMTIE